jgi:hypothetical protein
MAETPITIFIEHCTTSTASAFTAYSVRPGRLPTVAVVTAFAVVAWFALAFRRVASFFRGAFPHVVRRKSLLRKGANRLQLLQQFRIEILPKEG